MAVLGAYFPTTSLPGRPSSILLQNLAHRRHLGEDALRALRKRVRVRPKRDPQPSAAIVDSQSIKTTGVGGEQRGYDGGKQIEGRKRHILVDTQGSVLEARDHGAGIQEDREGIKLLLDIAARDRLSARAPLSPMAGLRIHRRRQGCGLGAKDTGMDRTDRATP